MFLHLRVKAYTWGQGLWSIPAREHTVAFLVIGGVVLSALVWNTVSAGTMTGSDTFTRSVSSGWGSAELGGAYTLSGTAADFNVDGSVGTIRNASNATKEARLQTIPIQDTDIKVKLSTDKLAAGTSLYTGMLARRTGTGDHYRFHVRFSVSQGVFLKAAKYVSGTEVGVSGEYQAFGVTHATNSFIWVRAQAFGTNPTILKMRTWADGQPEPSTWTVTTTDSEASLQGAGSSGIRAYSSASFTNYPVTFSFDDFTVTDGVDAEPPPPTPGPPPSGPYTYASDLFERESASTGTWEEADTGGAYTLLTNPADYSLTGEEGTINVSTPGMAASRQASLTGVSAQDVEALVRVKVDKMSADDNAYAYISARQQPSGAEYRARVKFRPNGNYGVQAATVTSVTSGSDNLIASEVDRGAYSANSYIWVRLQLIGTSPTTINIKAWPDGQGEPRNWSYTATDSTPALQAAGSIGLTARTAGAISNMPLLYTFDDFQVTNIITSSYPPGVTPPPLPNPEYFVSPSGLDTNPGTIDQPWRTLKYALTQISPGHTLTLRGGTYYNEGGSRADFAGTAENKIVIRSYPGERAIIDGSVPDYATENNGAWELVDGSIGLYRTVRSDFVGNDLAGSNATLSAWLIDQGIQLTHYGGAKGEVPASINSTNYSLSGFNPLYHGPGVQLRGDGHVYIRLTQNPNDLTDINGDAIAPVPASSNPNNNRLAIGTTSVSLFLDGASYVTFKDIDFVYSDFSMRIRSGTNNITIDDCNFIYGYQGLQVDDAINVEVKNSRFSQGVPEWVHWTDVKNGSTETSNGYPEFSSNSITGVLSGWNVHDNTFRNGWDGLQIKSGTTNMTLNNNTFLNNRDDAVQVRTNVSNIEIASNLMRHVHNGFGALRSTGGTKGPIYMHHNVVDASKYQRTGRPGNSRGPEYGSWSGSSPFEGHGSGDDDYLLRFYNNTVLGRRARGSNSLGPRVVEATAELYVYNNLWYTIGDVPALGNHQESSGAHYEGNVFWQYNPGVEPLMRNFGNAQNYANLTSYVAVPGLTWERKGLQIDPGLSLAAIDSTLDLSVAGMWEIYRPTNLQMQTLGASYSGLGWPGTVGVDYRGALAPPTPQPPSSPGGGNDPVTPPPSNPAPPTQSSLQVDSDTTTIRTKSHERIEWKAAVHGGTAPYTIDWEWGDGDASHQNALSAGEVIGSHTYKDAGVYEVVLKAADNTGQAAQLTLEVIVEQDPQESVGALPGTKPADISSGGYFDTVIAPVREILELLRQQGTELIKRTPPPVARAFSYVLSLSLVALISIYAWLSLAEAYRARRIMTVLGREKTLSAEKENFIALTSHYLRTPLTIIGGGIDIAASERRISDVDYTALKQGVQELHSSVEGLILAISDKSILKDIKEPNMSGEKNRVYTSPMFLTPIGLVAATSVGANYLFTSLARIDISVINQLGQVAVLAVVASLLYVVLRSYFFKLQYKEHSSRLLDHQRAIDQARNDFIYRCVLALQVPLAELGGRVKTMTNENDAKYIKSGYTQLQKIVNRFELIIKLQAGNIEASAKNLAVNDLLHKVIENNAAYATASNVYVSAAEVTDTLTQDPVMLSVVLNSLIENAIKFSPEGATVQVAYRSTQDAVQFTVTDHGNGMSQEQIELLFKPFSRAESSLEFNHEGMGLGLYMDKVILAYLNGDIVIMSPPGEGVSVRVTVPKNLPQSLTAEGANDTQALGFLTLIRSLVPFRYLGGVKQASSYPE